MCVYPSIYLRNSRAGLWGTWGILGPFSTTARADASSWAAREISQVPAGKPQERQHHRSHGALQRLRPSRAFRHHHSERAVLLMLGAFLAAFAAKPACRAVWRFVCRFLQGPASSTGSFDNRFSRVPGSFGRTFTAPGKANLAGSCRNRKTNCQTARHATEAAI